MSSVSEIDIKDWDGNSHIKALGTTGQPADDDSIEVIFKVTPLGLEALWQMALVGLPLMELNEDEKHYTPSQLWRKRK